MQVDAAGSYVNIVVYLASQVFYPAYLTYLQEKKPDKYNETKVFLEKYTDPKRIMKTHNGREPGFAIVLLPLDGSDTRCATGRQPLCNAVGSRLNYSKHYISDYIIKRGKAKKKPKHKKASRMVNKLMKILRQVLEELDNNLVTPDHVKALARYAKDTLELNADAKSTSALAQRYVDTASQVSDTALEVSPSQHSNISGVTMYVQDAIDKVVKELEDLRELESGTSAQKRPSVTDKTSLVAESVVSSTLEEIRLRLTAEGARHKTLTTKDADRRAEAATSRRSQLELALTDAASLIAHILADTIDKFLLADVERKTSFVAKPSTKPSLSDPATPTNEVKSPSPDFGFVAGGVESDTVTNIVNCALRSAAEDLASESDSALAPTDRGRPTGDKATVLEFKPVELFFGDLPLPVSREIVEHSLSIISVKRDSDLDKESGLPCQRNSFRSLINPDVSRLQRLMASNREEASRNFIALAKRRYSVGSNEPFIPHPAADKQRHTVGNRETISEDFLQWLCEHAQKETAEDSIPEVFEPLQGEDIQSSASSGESEIVTSIISADAAYRPRAKSMIATSRSSLGSVPRRSSRDPRRSTGKLSSQNSRTSGDKAQRRSNDSLTGSKGSNVDATVTRVTESIIKQRVARPLQTVPKPPTPETPPAPPEPEPRRRSRPIKVIIPREPRPPSSLASRSLSSKSRSLSSKSSKDRGKGKKKSKGTKRSKTTKKEKDHLSKESVEESNDEKEIVSHEPIFEEEDRGARDGSVEDVEKGMVDETERNVNDGEHTDIEDNVGALEKEGTEEDAADKRQMSIVASKEKLSAEKVDSDTFTRRNTVVEPHIVPLHSRELQDTTEHHKSSTASRESTPTVRVRLSAKLSDIGTRRHRKRKSVSQVHKRRQKKAAHSHEPYY